MRTLQNNFTTPEQSKRLLELGVPADSADCCYLAIVTRYSADEAVIDYAKWITVLQDGEQIGVHDLPCWSVGRLIEICLICSTLEQRQVLFLCNGDDDYYNFMDYTINVLESGIITNHMDFSKLEE